MKNLLIIFLVSMLYLSTLNAQQDRINVFEDTFIQGGETSGEAFGETKNNLLRIGNSDKDNKYARISYLKFKMPKDLDDINKINLLINIKVFKKDNLPDETFKLTVFGLENDKWSESNITWEDALELGNEVGFIELPQSLTDKTEKVNIELNIDEIRKLMSSKKDKYVSLALVSYDSKTSAVITSKDSNPKFGPYLRLLK